MPTLPFRLSARLGASVASIDLLALLTQQRPLVASLTQQTRTATLTSLEIRGRLDVIDPS